MSGLFVPKSLPITGDGQTVTASTPLIDGTQTWNNVSTVFTAVKIAITDTISAGGSYLIDTQINGTSQFWVLKSGTVRMLGDVNLLNASQTASVTWGTSQDVRLFRDAAGTLALRNGTNAQTFNVYNTYTDASNYERTTLTWSSNVAYLRNQNAGTGSARLLVLVTGSTTVASLPAAATAGISARSFVTDALAPTFGAAVTGGGAVKIPVYSDGTTWLVG